MPTVEDVAAEIKSAITIPVVTQEVLELTASAGANARAIAKSISKDPILTAKILKTVNSSFFGFLFKTGDIQAAVVRLGVKQVRSLTVALGVGKLFNGGAQMGNYSRLGVWEHSLAVGIMCELLAKTSGHPKAVDATSEAMLAGLMHDIGIILAEQHLKEDYHAVLSEAAAKNVPLYEMERQKLGFDHAELGEAVLTRWRLPKPVCRSVGSHHDKEWDENDFLGKMCAMSEFLVVARSIGYQDMKDVPRAQFGHLQMSLGLVGKKVANLRTRFDARMEEARQLFGDAK